MEAMASLTVVFPTLPVMPMRKSASSSVTPIAQSPSAFRTEGTIMCGRRASVFFSARTAIAPRFSASAAYLCPSSNPFNAQNRSPSTISRESVTKRHGRTFTISSGTIAPQSDTRAPQFIAPSPNVTIILQPSFQNNHLRSASRKRGAFSHRE